MKKNLIDDAKPWEAPFWKPVKGKEGVLLYLVAIHVITVIGLILFPLPSLPVFAVALGVALLGGLGTTVCYHRGLSHRTLKMHPVLEHILIFFTVFNGSGSPQSWSANHRLHHAKADTDEDISSPRHGGFWWSHLRWLYQSHKADVRRWTPDLDKPAYRFWTLVETPLIIAALFLPLLWSWEAFFWVGSIRLVYSLHGQCFVNSIMHMGPIPEDGDTSKNLWWLGPFQLSAWGENWHRNHHSDANSARLGLEWWQVDVGWYVIVGLEKLGLVSDVRRPKSLRKAAAAARAARLAESET
jgi:stearoyl-CoA desaturase (delta-9 desaturase)